MLETPLRRSGSGPQRILHDPGACTGCGLCDLMCSLYHEGEQGPSLSRGELTGDRIAAEFTFNVCRQCASPDCYHACPLKDSALRIDESTGITYIAEEACTGCGACIDACPFEPSRIKMHPRKNIAFKCDLCRGRDEGPVCIEFCNFGALKVAGKEHDENG